MESDDDVTDLMSAIESVAKANDVVDDTAPSASLPELRYVSLWCV